MIVYSSYLFKKLVLTKVLSSYSRCGIKPDSLDGSLFSTVIRMPGDTELDIRPHCMCQALDHVDLSRLRNKIQLVEMRRRLLVNRLASRGEEDITCNGASTGYKPPRYSKRALCFPQILSSSIQNSKMTHDVDIKAPIPVLLIQILKGSD